MGENRNGMHGCFDFYRLYMQYIATGANKWKHNDANTVKYPRSSLIISVNQSRRC